MTGPGCHKKHTPIVSEAQRRFFYAAKEGKVSAPGLSKAEINRHLREAKGKKLVARVGKKLRKIYR